MTLESSQWFDEFEIVKNTIMMIQVDWRISGMSGVPT